ncbi:MAG: hypothetical protein PVF56_18035 [Desulfobacterales bacterium]|jgi:hypothetical protein
MATHRKETPNFFEDRTIDPVETATGHGKRSKGRSSVSTQKKKAGFYISTGILERFSRKFYELKLAGVGIDNKSTLLELALNFALDDMDRGTQSQILKSIGT